MTPSAPSPTTDARTGFDVQKVRSDFPILAERVHGKPLVYLDNANTSQKPQLVLDAMDDYYRHANANIHRATHLLSERATALYEGARAKAATFINAPDPKTIVLTKGTTDGINLVAQSYGRSMLKPGDEVVLSWLEHHSNIVPWQLVCEADRRAAASRPDQRRRGNRDRTVLLDAVAADANRGDGARVECAWDDQSGDRDHRAGARRTAPSC